MLFDPVMCKLPLTALTVALTCFSSCQYVDLKAVQWSSSEQDIPVRDVEIEENGVRVSVTLLQESATIPLAKNQVIVITHVKVDKNKRYGTNLTSSDYTVVHGEHADNTAPSPWEWCNKNRTLTDDQRKAEIGYIWSKTGAEKKTLLHIEKTSLKMSDVKIEQSSDV
ncbi:hypothetical protein NFI96_007623, partial [Prochilodus magdalenae]